MVLSFETKRTLSLALVSSLRACRRTRTPNHTKRFRYLLTDPLRAFRTMRLFTTSVRPWYRLYQLGYTGLTESPLRRECISSPAASRTFKTVIRSPSDFSIPHTTNPSGLVSQRRGSRFIMLRLVVA
jgi:hypothetical protein